MYAPLIFRTSDSRKSCAGGDKRVLCGSRVKIATMAILSLDGPIKDFVTLFAYGAPMSFLRERLRYPNIFMKECSNGDFVVFRVSSLKFGYMVNSLEVPKWPRGPYTYDIRKMRVSQSPFEMNDCLHFAHCTGCMLSMSHLLFAGPADESHFQAVTNVFCVDQ